ncbi:MAG: quinolinate synthase NadA [Ruminococcaceae bacterium]|nr:quinolinate synthase NadA [Oscillospiraceae bacterium]
MDDALRDMIAKRKAETDTVVLAHTYQPPEIIELADITGDSFALAKAAAKMPNKRIIMCGVRFMAESVKILAPEKEVILPAPDAGCGMARMIKPEEITAWKEQHPDACVCAYINTTAAVKAVCDVCVTSSSALKIVGKLDAKEILFLPDRNLGGWIAAQCPDKKMTLWNGYCPVHDNLTEEQVLQAKNDHPDALLAVHPECREEVVRHADMAGSTSEIIDFALKADKPVIIGTERGVADTLTKQYPDKEFYYLCPETLTCPDMKYISPELLLQAINGEAGEQIELDEELRLAAKKSIDRMLELG